MTVEAPVAYDKPLPKIEPDQQGYWDSLKAHAMRVQRCGDCGRWYFPPRTLCPQCLSSNVEWTLVSGRGTVYSTVTYHRAFSPAYRPEDLPYNLSIIELEEGPRVLTNVVGCPVDQVAIGMPVEVVYDDVNPEITLARFRPRS